MTTLDAAARHRLLTVAVEAIRLAGPMYEDVELDWLDGCEVLELALDEHATAIEASIPPDLPSAELVH